MGRGTLVIRLDIAHWHVRGIGGNVDSWHISLVVFHPKCQTCCVIAPVFAFDQINIHMHKVVQLRAVFVRQVTIYIKVIFL